MRKIGQDEEEYTQGKIQIFPDVLEGVFSARVRAGSHRNAARCF
jgi:hypothetical protein